MDRYHPSYLQGIFLCSQFSGESSIGGMLKTGGDYDLLEDLAKSG
jgi:hypothetical protein